MYDNKDAVRQIVVTGGGDIFPRIPPQDRSDPSIFRFEDYSDAEDMAKTLHALFPIGTARSDIEKVLVKWAGSYAFIQNNEPHHVLYNYRIDSSVKKDDGLVNNPHVWNILVWYNSDDTAGAIFVDNSTAIQVFGYRESGEYLRAKIKEYNDKKEKP